MAKKATPRRSFSDEFKQDAVNRVLKGEKLSAVARELGVNPNNLYLWKGSFASGVSESLNWLLKSLQRLSRSQRIWLERMSY